MWIPKRNSDWFLFVYAFGSLIKAASEGGQVLALYHIPSSLYSLSS